MFLLYLARRAAVAVKSAPDVKTAVGDCIRLAEKLASEASKLVLANGRRIEARGSSPKALWPLTKSSSLAGESEKVEDSKGKRLKRTDRPENDAETKLLSELQAESLKVHGDPRDPPKQPPKKKAK